MDVELFIYELKFLKRRIIEIQRINRRDIRKKYVTFNSVNVSLANLEDKHKNYIFDLL